MDLKKLAGQAGQLLTRAVQYTEEKLGNAEKTEFDGHYESLVQQFESTKLWTEKVMNGAQAVLIPNPGNRVEDMIFERMEKKRPNRLSNLEYLGLDMVQAGNEFGPGTAYGSALLKVGGAEQKLGLAEREFVSNALEGFVQPLNKFLDTEIKTIARERRVLDTKRLDLDACKSQLRKARSMDAQSVAEADLRKAQADFDRQTEITKLLLEGVRSTQASHLQYLNEIVESQITYFERGHSIMMELKQELSSVNSSEGSQSTSKSSSSGGDISSVGFKGTENSLNNNQSPPSEGWRKAKVVCDYDATAKEEISLKMNENVEFSLVGSHGEFVMVRKGTNVGRVPRAYLEALDD